MKEHFLNIIRFTGKFHQLSQSNSIGVLFALKLPQMTTKAASARDELGSK